MRRALRWLFVDRTTGRIVVAQWPNVPLWIYIVATILRWSLIASVALAVWAILEIVKGVNPFRRLLGGLVILGMLRP
ncbi:MAG TPA: hypothetical protein VMZ22_13985 [Acidimicrobiales bacterium]|nr:hypothetical protein [Acidimicrobiales bacterium]